jgi:hypothetical protein
VRQSAASPSLKASVFAEYIESADVIDVDVSVSGICGLCLLLLLCLGIDTDPDVGIDVEVGIEVGDVEGVFLLRCDQLPSPKCSSLQSKSTASPAVRWGRSSLLSNSPYG